MIISRKNLTKDKMIAWYDATAAIKPTTKQQLHLQTIHLPEEDMQESTHMDTHSWCRPIKR